MHSLTIPSAFPDSSNNGNITCKVYEWLVMIEACLSAMIQKFTLKDFLCKKLSFRC